MAKSIALIGAGAMGKNHARTIANNSECSLEIVIDVDRERSKEVASVYGCEASDDIELAFRCDAVVLASSTPTHYEIAKVLLGNGIPVLIEKPLAATLEQTRSLVEFSQRLDVAIMCGFVERFNPVVIAAKNLLEQGERVVSVSTKRHSPVAGRSSSSVTWDLLIHDIDLVLNLFGQVVPSSVQAISLSVPNSEFVEVTEAIVGFGDASASLSSSRIGHRKIREVSITTDRRLLELDLLRQTLTTYQNVRQEQILAGLTTYRAETVIDIPFVRRSGEPLELQLRHFMEILDNKIDARVERDSICLPHEVAEMVENCN